MATSEWNPAMLGKLKALLAKGLSTAEIGKKLGITKNSVVGKLNRLGWNAKAVITGAKPKSAKPAAAKSGQTAKPILKKVTKPAATKNKPAATAKAGTAPKPAAATKSVAKPTAKPAPKPLAKSASPAKSGTSVAGSKNLAMHQRIVQHSLELAALRPDQCRWPIGDPDSEKFHFCGATVFVGKPYCYEHCKQAYQFAPVKGKK